MERKFDQIFLDMDQVIADFDSAAAYVHKQPMESLIGPRDWNLTNVWKMGWDEFHQPIDEIGEKFWLNLLPLPWHTKLLDICRMYAHEVIIASSPSSFDFTSCLTGKSNWLLKHRIGERLALVEDKSVLYHPGINSLLIDDRLENCQNFIAAGGSALVFPSQGNSYYAMVGNMEYVTDRIFDLLIDSQQEKV